MDVQKIQTLFNGELLRKEWVRKQYKLFGLIVVLLFLYILCGYRSMKQQRHLSDLKKEVKEAKMEYLTISAKRVEQTRQSTISAALLNNNSKVKQNREPVLYIPNYE